MDSRDSKQPDYKKQKTLFTQLSCQIVPIYFRQNDEKYTYSFILNYLTTKDWLNYRTVSKAALEETKQLTGPYFSFAEFVIATSGTYYNKKACLNGWEVYHRTIQHSHITDYAILYKMSNAKMLLNSIASLIDMRLVGRVYWPIEHNINVNEAWLLAQIHINRSLILVSDLTEENLPFFLKPDQCSAFAKEIAGAHIAGYRITAFDCRGLIVLSPSILKPIEMKQLTIRDIRTSDSEIRARYNDLSYEIKLFERINKFVKAIKDIIFLLNKSSSILEDEIKLSEIRNLIESNLKILDEKEHQKFICDKFISLWNTPPVEMKIEIPSNQDQDQIIFLIKKTVTDTVELMLRKVVIKNKESSMSSLKPNSIFAYKDYISGETLGRHADSLTPILKNE